MVLEFLQEVHIIFYEFKYYGAYRALLAARKTIGIAIIMIIDKIAIKTVIIYT